jgi:predicted NBD/HSP70 family sugar kinase
MLNANEQKVVDLIRTNQARTQAELCRLLGVNSSTMAYILARLKARELVVEEGRKIAGPGKPAVLLRYNQPGYIVGADIDSSRVLVGIMDPGGRIHARSEFEIGEDSEPAEVMARCAREGRRLARQVKAGWEQVRMAGISVNGQCSDSGVLEFSSVLPWKNAGIKEMAGSAFKLPVFCSDGRYRAVAECRDSVYKGFESILYFNAADGVSVKHVRNGELVLGSSGKSGEIGHVVFEMDGPECGCGQRGCLEALISGPAIRRKIARDSRTLDSVPKSLAAAARQKQASEVVAKLIAAADDGKNGYAQTEIKNILGYAARGLAMAVACFDPQLIVADGYVFRGRKELLSELEKLVQRLCRPKGAMPPIRSSVLGAEARLLSIAMLCGDVLMEKSKNKTGKG